MTDEPRAPFEGNYIESADLLKVAPVTLTIQEVIPPNTEKSADGRLIDKPIIVFEKAHKKLVCGKTNYRVLKALHGRESDWKGKQIVLGVRYLKTAFGQPNTPTVRVIPPKGTPIPASAWKHMGSATPWKD
jgi:hypothetical protein